MSSRVVERCVQPPAVWALVGSWSDREVTVYWGPPLLLASALTKEAAEVMWWVGVFTPCIYFINTGSGTELLRLRRTADGMRSHPSLCVGNSQSQTCASMGEQPLPGNGILKNSQTSSVSGL